MFFEVKYPVHDKLHPINIIYVKQCPHQLQIKIIRSVPIKWFSQEYLYHNPMKNPHLKFDLANFKIFHVKMVSKDRFRN